VGMLDPFYGEDTIEPGGHRLARGKASEGLGAQAAGLESKGDHLSAMSGITLEGKLLMIEQERAFSRVRT
jgi:hypothetical protein